MNFEKYKDITVRLYTPEIKNKAYVETLGALKPRPDHRKTLSVIGTVAAVVILLVAVTVWASIGNSIRTQDPVAGSKYLENPFASFDYSDVTSVVITSISNKENPITLTEHADIEKLIEHLAEAPILHKSQRVETKDDFTITGNPSYSISMHDENGDTVKWVELDTTQFTLREASDEDTVITTYTLDGGYFRPLINHAYFYGKNVVTIE